MPFDTYVIPTGEVRRSGISTTEAAGKIAEDVTYRYEAIAQRGGRVVTQHMINLSPDSGKNLMPHIMIVAEFPEQE